MPPTGCFNSRRVSSHDSGGRRLRSSCRPGGLLMGPPFLTCPPVTSGGETAEMGTARREGEGACWGRREGVACQALWRVHVQGHRSPVTSHPPSPRGRLQTLSPGGLGLQPPNVGCRRSVHSGRYLPESRCSQGFWQDPRLPGWVSQETGHRLVLWHLWCAQAGRGRAVCRVCGVRLPLRPCSNRVPSHFGD